jgi:hypothetical protein
MAEGKMAMLFAQIPHSRAQIAQKPTAPNGQLAHLEIPLVEPQTPCPGAEIMSPLL